MTIGFFARAEQHAPIPLQDWNRLLSDSVVNVRVVEDVFSTEYEKFITRRGAPYLVEELDKSELKGKSGTLTLSCLVASSLTDNTVRRKAILLSVKSADESESSGYIDSEEIANILAALKVMRNAADQSKTQKQTRSATAAIGTKSDIWFELDRRADEREFSINVSFAKASRSVNFGSVENLGNITDLLDKADRLLRGN
jgi:hypothetical protein